MSVHEDMVRFVQQVGEQMDANVRMSAGANGVPRDRVDSILEVHGLIRQAVSEPLLGHLSSVEEALRLSAEKLSEFVSRLNESLTYLEFFDRILESGETGVFIDAQNAKAVAAWRAETAAWLHGFVTGIEKASDGQGD